MNCLRHIPNFKNVCMRCGHHLFYVPDSVTVSREWTRGTLAEREIYHVKILRDRNGRFAKRQEK